MERCRIFMIGWECPPRITGGLGVACLGLARALARMGHRVEMLVPELYGDEVREEGVHLFDVKEMLPLLSAEEILRISGQLQRFAETEHTGVYASKSYRSSQSESHERLLPESRKLTERPIIGGYGDHVYNEIRLYADFAALIAKKLDIDIIHAHDWITYPAGLAARRATGLPLICHVHATEFDRSGDHINQYVYNLEREAYLAADAIITVSNYTKKILVERYAVPSEKIWTVHNGVEFEIPESSPDRHVARSLVDEKLVLFLGRMTFQKGPDYFVRAAQIVIERVKDVRFVMAGTGDMYHRMIEMAADLGIGKYFHYTGFLNRRQTIRIFAMSDLYIMPSVSEPFGISPLEAMTQGVPVIVSKQSGVCEVISNCVKVDFWNIEEIAASMICLLTDEDLTDQMRDQGRQEVRQITWETAARKVEKIYEYIKMNH